MDRLPAGASFLEVCEDYLGDDGYATPVLAPNGRIDAAVRLKLDQRLIAEPFVLIRESFFITPPAAELKWGGRLRNEKDSVICAIACDIDDLVLKFDGGIAGSFAGLLTRCLDPNPVRRTA